MLRHLRGAPQYFGLQASYRPEVLDPVQASFKACLCRIPHSHSFSCLFVRFEVLILELEGFLSSKSWIKGKLPLLIYFFFVVGGGGERTSFLLA